MREYDCVYDVDDSNVSRSSQLKKELQAYKDKTRTLEAILNKLRSQNDDESTHTLARLRLGDDIATILREEASWNKSPDESPAQLERADSEGGQTVQSAAAGPSRLQ